MHLLSTVALILLVFTAARADESADLSGAMRRGQQDIQNRLSSEVTNVDDIAEGFLKAYDARHPTDLWLEVLSQKDLQKLAKSRPNDFEPRLMQLPRELVDDKDCEDWFATLKECYVLATNEEQRVTCLVFAMWSVFALESKPFGRPMLAELKRWLTDLSFQRPTRLEAKKIQLLKLFVALGIEAYADVPVYAQGTPFRTLAPLWMMSKGKWEMALKEVLKLKDLPDLDKGEKATLDGFEPILRSIVEKKSRK